MRVKLVLWLSSLCSLAAMSAGSPSVQMDEVRRRCQSLLSVSGSAQDVKADVQTMANIPLPLSEKYRHFGAEAVLRENTAGRNKQEVKLVFFRLNLLWCWCCHLSYLFYFYLIKWKEKLYFLSFPVTVN